MKRILLYLICFFTFVFCWSENQKDIYKLTQAIVNKKSGTFVITRNYDLDGKTIVFPKGLVVKFQGGEIDNGTLVGTNTKIQIDKNACVFGKKIKIQGSWSVKEIYDKWFEFDSDKRFISNQLIKNILSLSNDEEFCHIYFNEDRIYYFNLQTQRAPNIGNGLPFNKEKKKHNYSELFGERYADYHIFIIPSNTWVTINSKLQMLPTNQGLYFVFWECGKKNVTIDGKGSISGDGMAHLYTDSFFKRSSYYGEWGYIFKCLKCENFVFKDIELSDSFGDLLSYGCYPVEDNTVERGSNKLLVENVKFIRARRNGISVTARDVTIRRCLFQDCGIDEIRGTAPRAAIDFECDQILQFPGIGNENVLMENCIFNNNKHDVSATNVNVPNYGKTAVTIQNCYFSSPLRLNATPQWIMFENCTIPSFTNRKEVIDKSSPIRYVEFRNCSITKMPKLMFTQSWHNKFVNCKIKRIE